MPLPAAGIFNLFNPFNFPAVEKLDEIVSSAAGRG
jgi:hypothetical protein